MKSEEMKLLWHWLFIIYAWSRNLDVDDETAFVALTRLKAWVDKALGIIEGNSTDE